jgi:hypothetical protein
LRAIIDAPVGGAARSCAWLAVLAGCVQSVTIGPPPLELENGKTVNAVITVLVSDGSSGPLVFAAPASNATALPPFSRANGEKIRLHAWLYSQTLDELLLAPGLVPVVGGPTCQAEGSEVSIAEPLPEPEGAYLVDLPGDEGSEWRSGTEEQTALRQGLFVPRRIANPCVGFDVRSLPLRGCGETDDCYSAFMVADDPSFAWVGRILGPEGLLYAVSNGEARLVGRTATAAEAAVAIGDEIVTWNGLGSFACTRGLEGAECERALPAPTEPAIHGYATLEHTISGGVESYYALRDDGRLWRWSEQRWFDVPIPGSGPCETGSETCRVRMASHGSDVFAIVPFIGEAYYLDGFRVTRAILPPADLPDDIPISTLHTDRLGRMIGTSRGRLLQEVAPNEWSHVASLAQKTVHALVELDDGVLFGTQSGLVAQFHPGFGVCAVQGVGFTEVFDIIRVGQDYVLTGERSSEVVWLERIDRPGDPCGTEQIVVDGNPSLRGGG